MIRTIALRKRYGRSVALDGLDLHVPEGALYGFIGENGAGKTTTIRILASLLQPDDGDAEIGGHSVRHHAAEARRLVGYMPDFFGVYEDLKVSEYLQFYAELYGIRGAQAPGLRNDLLELVDLGHKRDAYVDGLSRGMQQRLCLARALVHDPQVLLLDEPASGLDPIARAELRDLLRELSRMGKTILISSHILTELSDLCTHVGMLAGGRLGLGGPITDVLSGHERGAYLLRTLRDPEGAVDILEQTEGVTSIAVAQDGEISFRAEPGPEAAAAALAAVTAAGIPVAHFGEVARDLESMFVPLAHAEGGRG